MNFKTLAAGIIVISALTSAAWADGSAAEETACPEEAASAPSSYENEEEYDAEPAQEDREMSPEISPLDEFLMQSYHTNDVTQVTTVWDNCSDKDDVAVTLYLAELSGVSAVDINMARRDGKHWQDIIKELELNEKAILPEFQKITVTKSNLNKVLPIRVLQNWAADPDKYELYDKTLRQLCNAELLMRNSGLTPMKAYLRTEEFRNGGNGPQHFFGAVEPIIPE
ncbi:hypothetical protein IJT93_09870 [bacterium]|nr:hypothetical protein [bacterium]